MYRQNPVEWTSASPPLCFFTHSITVTPTTAVFYLYYVTTSLESSGYRKHDADLHGHITLTGVSVPTFTGL